MRNTYSGRLTPPPALRAALAAGLLLLAAPAGAQDTPGSPLEGPPDFNRGGRTAFQFLKIGVGARQAALGEASVALVRDASAAFWNPAGIAGIERYGATLSYARWLGDLDYVAAAGAARWPGVGTFAVSIASLDYGDIPEAIVGYGADGDDRTGNTFSGGDFMAGLAIARDFTDRLAVGVGVKYLHEQLWNFGTGAVAFDLGTNYEIGFRGLRLAMAAQNLGGAVNILPDSMTDRSEGYDLPLTFRVGIAGDIAGTDGFLRLDGTHRVVGVIEAINTNDYSERLHVGAEYTFNDLFAVRAGYRMNTTEVNWSLGAGIAPRIGNMRLSVDYAYVGYEFLDAPHRISVSFAY